MREAAACPVTPAEIKWHPIFLRAMTSWVGVTTALNKFQPLLGKSSLGFSTGPSPDETNPAWMLALRIIHRFAQEILVLLCRRDPQSFFVCLPRALQLPLRHQR
jgi:hypothetical protein